MEPGDNTAVSTLLKAQLERVVIGIRHPLSHLRGNAIRALRSEGVQVDVLGENLQCKFFQEALKSCQLVNAHLIYRAASRVPFSVLKYAMTSDGKIASSSGDAAGLTSNESRHLVFELRGRSNAVIVGGTTVRKNNPKLTTRHGGGHLPTRIVMSQTLNLPDVANLWDVSEVSTIVATQRGVRKSFQKYLASKDVEVVEFDILDPRDVMEYFYDRGYLSILWECGGKLAASAISSGVIHKVYAIVAPKIIGGNVAPSLGGEHGMVEMSHPLEFIDTCSEQIGPDLIISGFIQPIPDMAPIVPSVNETSVIDPSVTPCEASIISFYKTWDPYGAFSNFSPHPIQMPDGNGDYLTWSTAEHYYQASKFLRVEDPFAKECFENIKSAKSPEEAARMGRKIQRQCPHLVRPDWDSVKVDVMYEALKCKFSICPHLNSMLLSTAGSVLVEASPHDLFWGGGREGEGLNYLGSKEGLVPWVEYNEKKIVEVKVKEIKSALTTQIAKESDISEVTETVKQRVKDAKLPDIEIVRILWDAIMDAVQWSGKNHQQNANSALRLVKTWAPLLNTFCSTGKLELELIYKVQIQCYEDANLMKLFPEIVRSLYEEDVLAEDTILLWFHKGTNPKGRQTFVKALKPFVKLLEEAEEED